MIKFRLYAILAIYCLATIQISEPQLYAQTQTEGMYTISGKVSQAKPGEQVVLSLFNPVSQARTAIDTSLVSTDGTYALKYKYNEPDLYRVDFPGRQNVLLVVGQGQSNIGLNVEGKSGGWVEIKGSPDSEKLLGYEIFREESNDRLVQPANEAMRSSSDTDDKKAEIEAIGAYVVASEKHRKELLDYTAKHIGTSIALYGTMLRWTGDEEIARLEKLVSDFKTVHPNLKMTAVMADKVARFKSVAIGAIAPLIIENDVAGSPISLYAVKGKYTLIDFWASWCGPCLRQFPEMKQAYDTFKPKGFEIYSISIDSRAERWKAASEKYELNWPNVSDAKGWESAHAAAYNVTFIPFNLLIDENGVIIAKNLHSLELFDTLAKLLNE